MKELLKRKPKAAKKLKEKPKVKLLRDINVIAGNFTGDMFDVAADAKCTSTSGILLLQEVNFELVVGSEAIASPIQSTELVPRQISFSG